MRTILLPALLVAALAVPGCSGRNVDIAKALQVTDVTTGWLDLGIVEGNKNKLVPTISLRIKNTDKEAISSVQLFARFNIVGDPQELGSSPYVSAIGPDGLAAGQTTAPMVLTTNVGYTGEQPRLDMLQHSEFKDAQVQIFAKYHANPFVKLYEHQIARQLVTK